MGLASTEAYDVRHMPMPRSRLPGRHPLSNFSLTRAFALFDRDHDGKLSVDEYVFASRAVAFLSEASEAGGTQLVFDESELVTHFEDMGADETGGLFFDDFAALMKTELGASKRRQSHRRERNTRAGNRVAPTSGGASIKHEPRGGVGQSADGIADGDEDVRVSPSSKPARSTSRLRRLFLGSRRGGGTSSTSSSRTSAPTGPVGIVHDESAAIPTLELGVV